MVLPIKDTLTSRKYTVHENTPFTSVFGNGQKYSCGKRQFPVNHVEEINDLKYGIVELLEVVNRRPCEILLKTKTLLINVFYLGKSHR